MLAPYRALVAWLFSAAILAAIEWVLLLVQAGDAFASFGQKLGISLLGLGNVLPYALATVCAFGLIRAGARWAERRVSTGWGRLTTAAVVALAALPYAIWLGRFTFSGPQARVLPLHGLWVVVTTLVISLGYVGAAGFHYWRAERQRKLWVAWLLVPAVVLSIWLNGAVLANEYEPLHTFLGSWSLILSVLLGHEIAALVQPALLRFAVLGASGAGILAIFSGMILARAEEYAWIVWSHTATSRYITVRWPSSRVAFGEATSRSMPLKPGLENAQTKAWRARRATEPAPNIVIFSIDGLRYDHVGAYGYKRRPSTPNIDRFARRGARFDRAYSYYPMTKNFNSGLLLGRSALALRAHTPPADYRELAITRLLDRRGYHMFVKSWFEHSSSKSFDPKKYAIDTNVDKQPGPQTVPMRDTLERIAEHLAQAKQRREPVFIWLHLLETHIQKGSFIPNPDRNFGDSAEDRYDSAVAGCDLWLEHLEPMLVADATRPTVWVILSDHGTRLDSQGRSLEEHIARVPLIIVAPDVRPQVINQPVDAALDVAATIVDYAGMEPPAVYEGISLIPVLAMGDFAKGLEERLIPLSRGPRSLGGVRGPFKFLEQRGAISLFNVVDDPDEKRNVIGEHAELAEQMVRLTRTELDRRAAAYKQPKSSSDRAQSSPADNDDDEH